MLLQIWGPHWCHVWAQNITYCYVCDPFYRLIFAHFHLECSVDVLIKGFGTFFGKVLSEHTGSSLITYTTATTAFLKFLENVKIETVMDVLDIFLFNKVSFRKQKRWEIRCDRWEDFYLCPELFVAECKGTWRSVCRLGSFLSNWTIYCIIINTE